jgi:hypothetical protein
MRKVRNAYKILAEEPDENSPFDRPRPTSANKIRIFLRAKRCEDVK